MNLFDASIYAARRHALIKALGQGILLFPGATDQPINYKGNTYPFRQDSSFLYYFGLSQPGLSGIIDADAGESILVGREADMEDVVWMGPQPSLAERMRSVGVERSLDPDALGPGWPDGTSITCRLIMPTGSSTWPTCWARPRPRSGPVIHMPWSWP